MGRSSVEHDDVNIMCIGAQIVGPLLAKDLITAYLEAEFSTHEDFRRRVAKLHDMDAGNWLSLKLGRELCANERGL